MSEQKNKRPPVNDSGGLFMSEKILMNADDIRRAVSRLTHEILEKNRGPEKLGLIGMCTRGVPLARRIEANILEIEKFNVPVGILDIGLYRDDLLYKSVQPVLHRSEIPFGIDDMSIIIIDDVLFTGRSIRAAMDEIMDFGRPANIQLAVLIDRGHRELPIRADYVGKNIPTARDEEVLVHLKEIDGNDQVIISNKNKGENQGKT